MSIHDRPGGCTPDPHVLSEMLLSDEAAMPTVAEWPARDASGRIMRPAPGQVGTLHEQLRKIATPRPRPAFEPGDLEQLRRQVLMLQRRLFGEGGYRG